MLWLGQKSGHVMYIKKLVKIGICEFKGCTNLSYESKDMVLQSVLIVVKGL